MRILRFNWLICLYLFMSLVRIASFLIVKIVVSGKNSLIFRFFFRHNFNRSLCKNIFLVSDHSVLNKNYEKARTESSKNREKKNDQKNRNGKILRTFGPYILTKTTQKCAHFVHILLVIHFLIIFCSSFRLVQSND